MRTWQKSTDVRQSRCEQTGSTQERLLTTSTLSIKTPSRSILFSYGVMPANNVSPRETANERATRAGVLPLEIQPVTLERRQFRECRRCLHVGQRRIVSFLVAANVVFATETARGDFNQSARFHGRAAGLGAGADGRFEARGFHLGYLLEESARHRMC